MKPVIRVTLALVAVAGVGYRCEKKCVTTETQEIAMKGFVQNIQELTEKNANFRKVVYTGKHLQLVVMSLKPGEEIGEETHSDRDQFFRIQKGQGEIEIDGRKTKVDGDLAMVVPAGARHNIKNVGVEPLRLYTIYGPPEHMDGTVQVTKAEAMVSKEHFTGQTTE